MIKKLFERFWDLLILGRSEPLETYWDVIGWWEIQRVTYNLVVGIAGIFTGLIISCVGVFSYVVHQSDYGLPDPPLFAIVGILVYAIAANIFYTGGWVTELFIRQVWPNQSDKFANRAYFYGVILSVLMTLCPGIVVLFFGVLKLVAKINQ
jgi:hypothetical protein